MPLLPVADVLLVEHRRCRCGSTSVVASPHRYRLFKACQGEPDKTVIRALKYQPEKAEEQLDLTPLPERVVRDIDIPCDVCLNCWGETLTLAAALSTRPPTPIQHYSTSFSVAWTKAQSAATGKAKKPPIVALEDL